MSKSKKNIEAIYPLSPMQEGMLFHSVYEPESSVYFEQVWFTIDGQLDIDLFKKALSQTINRHEVLRTSFSWKKLDKLLQIVHGDFEVPFLYEDWSSKQAEVIDSDFNSVIDEQRKKGFDLNSWPLIRISLFKTSNDGHKLLWNNHHILFDGWSTPVIFKDVFTFYELNRLKKETGLPPLRPFKDYISWLKKQSLEEAKIYWQKKLAGFYSPTNIGFRESYKEALDYDSISFKINPDSSQTLQSLAKQQKVTLNTIVQSAWALLLSRYSNESDIVFGTTVSGRPPEIAGIEDMVGLFINTLPVRVDFTNLKTVSDLLQFQHNNSLELRSYEYTPLVQVQTWSDLQPNTNLFDSIVVFENYPVDSSLKDQQLSLRARDIKSYEQTNFPLTVAFAAREEISIQFAFQKPLFSPEKLTIIYNQLQTILEHFAANPAEQISNVSLIREKEKNYILENFNSSQQFEVTKNFIEIFEERVKQHPDKDAVLFENQVLSYNDLNRRSNQIAHFLREKGFSFEDLIAISFRPGLEQVSAMLGILKCGAAYIPIDPDYPQQRIDFILKDTSVKVLLTTSDLADRFNNVVSPLFMDTLDKTIDGQPNQNPGIFPDLDNLAYMIYTSGSTGTPKGTMLSHRGLFNLCDYQRDHFNYHEYSRVLQFASLSFDASVSETFATLYMGATLIIANRDQRIPGAGLNELIKIQNIDTITLPPSVTSLLKEDNFPSLNTIISAGEACSPELAMSWRERVNFINGYGPTENTVCAATYAVTDAPVYHNVPIGKPMYNCKLYILDQHLNPVPISAPGELHIAGESLARGYFARPELSAEKFIPDPFSNSGERLYKTGDLARYREDGNIEFLGRIDSQVKIRGFRIELGEIDFSISEIAGINDSVSIVRKDRHNQQIIVSYIISDQNKKIDPHKIKEGLREVLPDYMIPTIFVQIESFPLTTHGKIDKNSLPEPSSGDMEGISFVAPRNAAEETLSIIWSDILGIEKISIQDNFFDLGGHSLLATKLIARIREAFAIDLPLRSVFDNNTIELLSRQIEIIRRQGNDQEMPKIVPFDRAGDIPVSLPQQRLWFIDQFSNGNAIYNIPFTTKIKGDLNVPAFEKSINIVIARHESLRTTFSDKKGIPFENILDEYSFKLQVLDLQQNNSESIKQESLKKASEIVNWQFNLSTAPLFRIELIKVSENEHLLVAVMHHIISDGWSMNILINEVLQNYNEINDGKEAEQTKLPIQYADFAAWQQDWLKGDVLEKQISYWKKHLGLRPDVLELNTDYKRPAVQTFNGKNFTFTIEKNLADGIRSFGKKEGLTSYVTLMALFQLLMNRYSGQKQILVGTPVAGRHHSTTQDLIGFFVNTLVIKAEFESPQTFVTLAKQVRENMLDAYAHQDVPFEQLVDALQIERDLAHSPLFQVAFIPQDTAAKLPETADLDFELFDVQGIVAKYDLSVYFSEYEGKFIFNIEYNSDLFKPQTIERMGSHYQMLLQKVVAQPKSRIDQIKILTPPEIDIIEKLNVAGAQFDSHLCTHHRFEKMVIEKPDNTALVFGNKKLSYSQLNEKANRVAHYLVQKGVSIDDIVGIHMSRSFEMIIAMLATMKAGAAYLPLDPSYPQERLSYMIGDSNLKILLTNQALSLDSQISNFELLNLAEKQDELKKSSKENLNLEISPNNLAYVIYTSGSTGKPKGTMLSHVGLVNLANEQRKAFEINDESRILQFASLSFDAATWETVMALLNGATLNLVERETTFSANELVKTIKDQKISTVTLPPSVLAVFPETNLPDLKTIITAGEKCPVDHVKKWQPGRCMVNAYGPTETSVCASMYFTNAEEPSDPPIGKNVGNFQLHILDKNLMSVPLGVSGELCISGVGLARGYLNQPAITADKFIPNPFSSITGDRLYKTGDLVKRLPDGNIDFLGRIDHQVKVRGFRIELGEIEASIHELLNLTDLFIMVREDNPGDQRIVAYTVGENDYDVPELKTKLSKSLPEYMVPSSFINLDEMPLTPNGKIDKKSLPAPEQDRSQLSKTYEAPRNENEEKLALIVSELLHIEKVGIHDSFFELGGHSLLATQFISRIREEFKVELPLRKLFETPTIIDIANALLSPEAVVADDDEPQIEALERVDDDLDELLGQLDGLSEEEIKALLDEEDADKNTESND